MDYKLISFDAESNGLHGEIFAIGAICLPTNPTSLLDLPVFEGRAPISGDVDSWVEVNVLPFIGDLTLYPTTRALRDAFWSWLQENKTDAIIVGDFGVPVEANLLAACQRDDPSRAWDHPYPLHELGTMLLAAGVDPDINREQYAAPVRLRTVSHAHNPLDDAMTSAHCWKRAWDEINKPKQIINTALNKLDSAGVWTGADDDLLDRLTALINDSVYRPK